MKRIFLPAIGLFLSALLVSIVIGSLGQKFTPKVPTTTITYEMLWKGVDTLKTKGLYKSASDLSTNIYQKALKEGNMPQLVKATIYRSHFQYLLNEEEALVEIINDLEKDCREVGYPATPLLHSIAAEMYWRYYEQNRYRILERSETTGITEQDIKTWDLKKIARKSVAHYLLSLQPADRLQSMPVQAFDLVLLPGKPEEARELRPTLYDFVAHRALDFFMNTEAGLTRTEPVFNLNKAEWFVNTDQFNNAVITSPDSLDFQYQSLKLLQELSRFHRHYPDANTLLDVELKRFRYLYQNATVDQKDTISIFAIRNLANNAKDFTESTELLYEIAQIYQRYGSEYNMGADESKRMYLRKAEEVCDQAIARFPYSQGGLHCKSLKAQINQKELGLTSGLVYTTNENLKMRLTYRNLSKVYVKLIRNTSDDMQQVDLSNEEKRLRYYLKMPLLKEWNLLLPTDDDKQNHATEFKVDSLKPGKYVLLVSSDPSFTRDKQAVAASEFYVSNIAYFTRQTGNGQLEVAVLHRIDGRPFQGVTVNPYISTYNYTTRKTEMKKGAGLITDAEGKVVIASPNHQNMKLELIAGNDKLFTNENFYTYPIAQDDKSFSEETFFFTDRAIYRPGQTVYFKGLIIERNGVENRIRKNKKTTVKFFDINDQQISSLQLVSNEFGTFHGSFTAPVGSLTGQMQVANESGSAYFMVEEYKRPKFEVVFDPVTGACRLGEEITFRAKAQTYSGATVDKAKVSYTVTRRVPFIDWPMCKSSISPARQEVIVAQGNAVTDVYGRFMATFEARPDFGISRSEDPSFYFTVTADVTDQNGETRSASQQIEISYQSVRMQINLQEHLQKESYQPLVIHAENCAGQRELIKGEVLIYKLKQPATSLRKSLWAKPDKPMLAEPDYQKYFPNDEWNDNTDPMKWKKEKEVFRTSFDLSKDSLLRIKDLLNWQSGYYILELRSKDKYEDALRLVKPFVLYSITDKQSPVNQPFWTKEIRKNAEPGDSDSILLATGEDELTILYELEQQGKIIKQEWITLKKEQKILSIPIEESYRGNVTAHFLSVKNNRKYEENITLLVPWSNKKLEINLRTYRNKTLPGSKEQWTVLVKDKKGSNSDAEMLASMYDASLDAFVPHSWYFDINPIYGASSGYVPHAFGYAPFYLFSHDWNPGIKFTERTYDELNWFGFERNFGWDNQPRTYYDMGVVMREESFAPAAAQALKADQVTGNVKKPSNNTSTSLTKVRSNFNETVFFYPQLKANSTGEYVFSFTMPDALTRWKAQFFAHTTDLSYGLAEQEIITQKELMVLTNVPRFVREGDTLELPVKVSSLTDSVIKGTATISLGNSLTGEDITGQLLGTMKPQADISLLAKESIVVVWKLIIPSGLPAITITAAANSTTHSDAEEISIPVLSDRVLVTESLPFSVRAGQSKTITFSRLLNSNSSTLQNHKYTLEYTSNPAWYAVQALPYMMEYPYECSEQVFTRYYANAMASYISNSNPAIKSVFNQWKQSGKEAFLSNLEKNQELKSMLLEESPWVMEAADEKEQKQRVALLFDLNKMSIELQASLHKLEQLQTPNGGWSWFSGMPDDRYITQYIVEGFGHLMQLKVLDLQRDARLNKMVTNAIAYLDQRLYEDHQLIIRNKEDILKKNVQPLHIHYLYARSFFPNIPMNEVQKSAVQYFNEQAKKYWLDFGLSLQASIALTLHRKNEATISLDILKSLRERSKQSEELGMYWSSNKGGYYWSQAKIETQSILIEAFSEAGNDQNSVDEMKRWLLMNKQTNNWNTTKATAEACYALLLSGNNWVANQSIPQIKVGNISVDMQQAEAGTGYVKQSWNGESIQKGMATIQLKNNNNSPAWGSVYWQYFEKLDNITSAESPLKIARRLFVERSTSLGKRVEYISDTTTINPGDRIKVRLVLETDRDMEYVHLKDLRAAGFEPENVLSGYRYQDGLGYYENTRDAAANFFISYLPKGTYVFEYALRASQAGSYSNGIATIQCMYAPEFGAHSEGTRLNIKAE